MDSTHRQLGVILVGVTVLTASIGYAAAVGPQSPTIPGFGTDAIRTSGAPSNPVDRLHGANYTGKGVKVGIIDVTGFETSQGPIADQVAATRSFGSGGTAVQGTNSGHGTATAAIVARTAPDAELYLTAFDTAAEFRQGVAWLLQQDVDVIVAPVSFFGRPGDGTAAISQAATRAARQGVVFVAAAGNVGQGHWHGRFDPVEEGTHLFENGTRNYLFDPTGASDRLVLWLSWADTARQRDFTLELYTPTEDAVRLLARSQPYRADGTPNERIVAAVDPDRSYYFVLRGPRDAAGTQVEVTSPTHHLAINRRAGSLVAPATGTAVVAVGAYDTQGRGAAPYSAVGHLPAGQAGESSTSGSAVDLVAGQRFTVGTERFSGTSASAAYVAGVAALVIDANPDAPATDVRAALTTTAADVGRPGLDARTGHGRVRPIPAIKAIRNRLAN
ncbi:MAG: S8 family serine peptidase [Halobacteriales archaeon]